MPQINKIEIFEKIIAETTYKAKFDKAVDNLPQLSYHQFWFSRMNSLSLPHSLQNTIMELLSANGKELTEYNCGEELLKLCVAYSNKQTVNSNGSIEYVKKIANLILKNNSKSNPKIIGTGHFYDVITQFEKGFFSNSSYTKYSEIKSENAKINKSFDIEECISLKNSQKNSQIDSNESITQLTMKNDVTIMTAENYFIKKYNQEGLKKCSSEKNYRYISTPKGDKLLFNNKGKNSQIGSNESFSQSDIDAVNVEKDIQLHLNKGSIKRPSTINENFFPQSSNLKGIKKENSFIKEGNLESSKYSASKERYVSTNKVDKSLVNSNKELSKTGKNSFQSSNLKSLKEKKSTILHNNSVMDSSFIEIKSEKPDDLLTNNLKSLKEKKTTILHNNSVMDSSFIEIKSEKSEKPKDLLTKLSKLLSDVPVNEVDGKNFTGSRFGVAIKVIAEIFEHLNILKINRKIDSEGMSCVSFEGISPYTVSGYIYESDYGGFIKINYKNKLKEDKCIEIIADDFMSAQGNFYLIKQEHFDKMKYNLVEILTGSNPKFISEKDTNFFGKFLQKAVQFVPHAKPISIDNDNSVRFVTDPKGIWGWTGTDPIVHKIINNSSELDDITKRELTNKSKYKYNYTGDQGLKTMSCVPIGVFRVITNVLNFMENNEIKSVINTKLNEIMGSNDNEFKYVAFYQYFSEKYFDSNKLFENEYKKNNSLVKDDFTMQNIDAAVFIKK